MKEYVWKIGGDSLEFKNGSMHYFNESKPAETLKDVLYFYYDVVILVGKKQLNFTASDYPKLEALCEAIDCMIQHKTKETGYLLEAFTHTKSGSYRKVFYHQMELDDMFYREHFFRIEKYHVDVMNSPTDRQQAITYKLTIGEIPAESKSESCLAWFLNDVSEDQLRQLGEVAMSFVQNTIHETNQWITKEGEG